MILASIPSPSQGVWHLGPLPIRGYALCIIVGIVVAVIVCDRRLQAKGVRAGFAADVATWAVPFGLVGARLYHLATDPQIYWGKDGAGTLAAFKIWDGGLGIWGAILAGALGAYIAARRAGVPFGLLADAAAPGVALAQACGRWGNWFNQELYGRPSGLPWALQIDPAHRISPYLNVATYQPTFLYESLWDIGVALLVLWAAKRFSLSHGRAFALYVMAYTVGRSWIEYLRIDYAHRFFGLRLNDWTCLICFILALAYFILRRNSGPDELPAAKDEDAPETVSGAPISGVAPNL